MAWLFSFIILLAVCHSSYTYRNQEVNEEKANSEEIHPQPIYPDKTLSNNEKQYRYKEKEQLYEVEKQRSKEKGINLNVQLEFEDRPQYKENRQQNKENRQQNKEIRQQNNENRQRFQEKVQKSYEIKSNTGNKSPARSRDSSESNQRTEKLWRFELDLPEMLRTLKKFTGVGISDANSKTVQYYDGKLNPEDRLRSSNDDGIFGQKIRIEMKPPNVASVLGYLGDLINVDAVRRAEEFEEFDPSLGWVEETPGVVKSEHVVYPKRYQEGRLKTLLKLKKKRDG